ncbi:uncharacterized protein [Nicotiana sylvestris]|uniref:uncharacterized protein n=1 Tax=Nicotiana sylvestris TaxID=4096 RepID=UPI00388C6F29
MNSHVDKCPKNPYNVEKGQKLLQYQALPGGNKGDLIPWKFDQEECRMALCGMVIVDELPFSFVEKEGFRNFMKVAQPCFHIPSRTTVTRDCFALFNVEKNKLMKFLKGTSQRIFTVTVDNASSNNVTVEKLSDKLDDWGTNSMNGQHLHIRRGLIGEPILVLLV